MGAGARSQVPSVVSVRSCPTELSGVTGRHLEALCVATPCGSPLQQGGCQLNELNGAQGRNRAVSGINFINAYPCWLLFPEESSVTHHPSRREDRHIDQDSGNGGGDGR